MLTKDNFDSLIRRNLAAVIGADSFGYRLAKVYENYYSREQFAGFVEEMKSERYYEAYRAYAAGKGGELSEQSGRYGKTPPKMASVASSSRFCYLALRDGAEGLGGSGKVEFEHECRIGRIGGTAPQLDAFVPNERIYVEVKCHEIFDQHHVAMSGSYRDLLFGNGSAFEFPEIPEGRDGKLEIGLRNFNISKAFTMFDIKQLLCHLMGIAAQKEPDEPTRLVYLFFRPRVDSEDEQRELDALFHELRSEIAAIFGSPPIRSFTEKNNIQLSAVAEYAKIMEKLSRDNMIVLYRQQNARGM